jgi:hypothetical protein
LSGDAVGQHVKSPSLSPFLVTFVVEINCFSILFNTLPPNIFPTRQFATNF